MVYCLFKLIYILHYCKYLNVKHHWIYVLSEVRSGSPFRHQDDIETLAEMREERHRNSGVKFVTTIFFGAFAPHDLKIYSGYRGSTKNILVGPSST